MPSGKFNRAVVVAMIAMRVMQVAVDQIVDMIAVRDRLVSASGPMNVIRGMGATLMVRRTSIRIFPAHLDPMFVDVVTMWMMQMPIMQIVDVVAVPDSGMAAVRAMLMVMVGMMRFVACAHRETPRFWGYCRRIAFSFIDRTICARPISIVVQVRRAVR
ncbi:MAG TPA: hypothetical protein VHC91_16435 [Trinickia sp.]|uniref:hypothetical protein n=1 Tax=Trinickia sp. TaxID=2571163 RepID=UPI002B59A9B2|nr:hypothetical protein [Trinickia sp.]HVW51951.1 hypothetical protein [Trinickia sp.]